MDERQGRARPGERMEWVSRFYSQQQRWAQPYSGGVQPWHREKVKVIERLAGAGRKRILELGAGGGQNALAAAERGHQVVAIELLPELVAHARTLATALPRGSLVLLEGDFYDLSPEGPFDVVCYKRFSA